MLRKIFVFVIVAVFVSSCSRNIPSDFPMGKFSCDFCRMQIVDTRFKAEAITKKGKIFHFDSIECLVAWQRQHGSEISNAWVTDFYNPSKWVALALAHMLKSPNLPSPMGGFLSAYSTAEELEKAKKEFGGGKIEPRALTK